MKKNRTKYKPLVMIIGIIAVQALSGCGANLIDGRNSNDSSTQQYKTNVGANNLVAFDQKLASITDTRTAKDAVMHFANYVADNRIDREYVPSKEEVQSEAGSLELARQDIANLVTDEMIMKVASRELSARQYTKMGLQGVADSDGVSMESQLVSLEKLTKILNSMQDIECGNTRAFTVDSVRYNQVLIRRQIPHLASVGTEMMTPLEASVIMYYILTGDDGSGKEGSAPLTADNKDIQHFLELLVS